MSTVRTSPEVVELARLVDHEAHSISHALTIAADKNDADAADLEANPCPGSEWTAAALRESAATRRRLAQRIEDAVNAVTYGLDDE